MVMLLWRQIYKYSVSQTTEKNELVSKNLRLIMSTMHSIVIILFTLFSEHEFTTMDNINEHMAIKNNGFHDIVLSYSCSYFIVDLVLCISSGETMFIFHHIISVVACYIVMANGHGGVLALQVLGVAECSTPLLNIGMFLAKIKNIPPQYFLPIWFIQTYFFLYFRLIVMTKLIFIYGYNKPFNTEYFFIMLIMSFILFGSVIWIQRQIHGIRRKLIMHNFL